MSHLFFKIMNLSLYAAILILVVILLRVLFQKAPKWISCLFWALVAVRLLCPVTIKSPFSLMPAADKMPAPVYQTTVNQESEVAATNQGQRSAIVKESDSVSRPNKAAIEDKDNDSLAAAGYSDTKELGEQVGKRNIKKEDVVHMLTIIWLIGFCAMIGQSLFSFWRLKHSVSASIKIRGDVRVCDEIQYPFILGIVRPIIYLPSFLNSGMKDYVLAHERAHLTRHDHWWKPLGFFLLAIHWFNPLCWIAYILFCRDMEMACDERVIRYMDRESKADYSETLLLLSSPVRRITACPVAFGEIGVKERVKGIINYKKPAVWVVLVAIFICTVTAVCFLTSPLNVDTVVAVDKSKVMNESEDSVAAGDVVYQSDIDGNGETDYICIDRLLDDKVVGDCVMDWSLVLNGAKVDSESNDLVSDFDVTTVDLDSDGKDEIVVKIKPHVNSMPLEEFSVLKQVGDTWVKLQSTSELGQVDGNGDPSNAFPVKVTVGDKPATLDIQVEGAEKIDVDVKNHYEYVLENNLADDLCALADDFLNQGKYVCGDEFGTFADWGIWEIEKDSIDGVSCLCATEGIASIEGGKRDIIGTVSIYFNYDADGKINILKTEFNETTVTE